MTHFKIKNPFNKIRLMLREIDNYYFFIKQMEIFADSGQLRHYKLKMNEKHAVYGAINLPPELLIYNKGDELAQLEKTFFGNEIAKLNDIIHEYSIIELYRIEYERIKTDDYYAFVFSISYRWNLCNARSIAFTSAWLLSAVSAAIYGLVYVISHWS